MNKENYFAEAVDVGAPSGVPSMLVVDKPTSRNPTLAEKLLITRKNKVPKGMRVPLKSA